MAKTQILDYYIHLTDKEAVDRYNDQLANISTVTASPDGVGSPLLFIPSTGKYAILRAPCAGGATVEFSAPCQDENVTFSAPCIRSPWFVPGANNFPRDVATFTRKSGGWFGIPALFGSTTKFYWAGHFVYAPPPGTAVVDGDNNPVTAPAAIPQRRWVHGWEVPNGEGSTGEGGMVGPAGSRWLGGWGYCPRNAGTSNNSQQFTSVPAVHTHWDRFRFQVVRFGTSASRMFSVEQVAQSGQGFDVSVTPGGQFVFAKDDGAVMSTAGQIAVGEWVKIDVLHLWIGVVGPPDVKIGLMEWYVNGERIAQISYPSVGGLTGNVKLSFSKIGDDAGAGTAYFNFDDWVGAQLPQDKDPTLAEWASGNSYTAGDVVQTTGKNGYPSNVRAFRCLTTHGSPSPNPDSAPGSTWVRLGPSKDWTVGSRIVPIAPTAVAGDDANWTGDILAVIGRNPEGFPSAPNGRTSSVAGAVTYCDTDIANVMNIPGALGIVAAIVNIYSTRGANSGTLGYNLNGAGDVMNAIVQSGAGAYSWCVSPGTGQIGGSLYTPSGLLEAVVPTSFRLRHTKGAGADASTIKSLRAACEVIGIFGTEDIPPGTVDVPTFPVQHNDKHNSPYEFSPYARNTSRAHAPVIIHTGTYVGNGTATNLLFRAPVHWLWVRRVTGTSDLGARWFSTGPGGWVEGQEGDQNNVAVRAEKDPTFTPGGGEDDQAERYRVTISGNDAQLNQNAVTYHYTAISDAAGRFMLGVATNADDIAPGLPFTLALANPNFTPLAGFFHSMSRSTTTSNTMGFKGSGMAATAGRIIGAASDVTPYVTFGAGSLILDTAFSQSDPDHLEMVLFRSEDGNLDPNAKKIWSQLSYVGDGAASRTLSFAPATGLRPVWAIVMGGNTFYRDPSHTGLNSTAFGTGTQATTGITGGGIDSISVGSGLNSNGTTYHVFVLWGSATAGNGGWSVDGEFVPVEPDSERPPTWGEPQEVPITIGGGGGGGGGPLIATPDLDTGTTPGVTDLGGTGPLGSSGVNNGGLVGGQACEVYTRALLNMALQRIGQSKVIVNAATDNTEEANIARQFVLEDVNQVLRDFPWPFATRYSALVLVGGTASVPVNNDWQYSYRAPSGMMFARRIAKSGVFRAAEPSPIQFREATDSTGTMIFCNEPTSAAVPLVLEWTARITCPAFYGDAKFRDALTWRFAASFAMPLAKDSKKQEFCLQMYEKVLAEAQVDAVNEAQESPFVDPDAEWISGRN